MSGDHGHLRAMRLLPFTAAAVKARLTLKRQQHRTTAALDGIKVCGSVAV